MLTRFLTGLALPRAAPLIFALCALAAPAAAWAGETACVYEQGVIVVPAVVAGVAGEYILDTGTADVELHETRAQGAGFEATALSAEVWLAGVALPAQPVAVMDLDGRTWAFPTPIAGVIGVSALKGLVLDVRFAPCRIGLYRAGAAPRFSAGSRVAFRWVDGLPALPAAVSDGRRAFSGAFALATGVDRTVRLDARFATTPGAKKPADVYPGGDSITHLRAMSFQGELLETVDTGLFPPGDGALAGAIGAPLLARHTLRFDFPKRQLRLAPP